MITIEDFKKKQTNKVRLLGLDLGSKRIGLSISDENQTIATPHKTLIKSSLDKLIDELKAIINENNIKGLIIGYPINMDGTKRVKKIDENAATFILQGAIDYLNN